MSSGWSDSVESSGPTGVQRETAATEEQSWPWLRRLRLGEYSLALIATLLAFLLRLLADPWLGDQSPYITFVVAVALTGMYAGVRPACLSAAMGGVIAYFCFVEPRYAWGFQGISDAVGFGVYVLTAAAVILLTHARNRAVKEAEHALEIQVGTTRKLLDAESLFRHFMDHSSACAYLRDEHGQCVYANDAAREVFGIREHQPEQPSKRGAGSRFRLQDEEVLRTGRAMQFLDKLEHPDRDRYWLTSKFPFADAAGHKFVGGISFEITERMGAEEILRKTERLSSAGQMASLLAHEINNPLAALTNVLFLLKDEPLDPRGRELLRDADQMLGRVNRIVRTTLGFYFEADTPAPLKVCRLIDEVADALTSVEAFRHVSVQREFDFDASIVASPPRIRQLITSLLTNAIESGSEAVRVRVRMATRAGRSGVCVTIADRGRGIAKEVRPRLFEPFFSTKADKGTGLGLWASKAIVLRNDGAIRLRSSSAAGRSGTCVRVFLPLAEASRAFSGNAGQAARSGR